LPKSSGAIASHKEIENLNLNILALQGTRQIGERKRRKRGLFQGMRRAKE
jgi:hypothetical protein